MFYSWPAESKEETQARLRVASKKAASEERRTRFLMSKSRAIGLDVQGLDQQLAENCQKRQDDRDLKNQEDNYIINVSNALQAAAAAEDAARREHRRQLQNHWTMQSRTNHLRPEADLYDPAQLRKDPVPSIGTVGVSAAQFFDGDKELVGRAEREEKMREQHAMISDKVAENQRMRELEAEEEALHARILKEQVRLRTQLAHEDAEARRNRNMDVQRTNEYLDHLRKEQARVRRELDEELAQQQFHAVYDSRHMREDRMTSSQPHRVVKQEWKGMTPQELDNIRATQAQQRSDRAQARADADREEKELDDSIEQMRRFAVTQQRNHDQEVRAEAFRRRLFQEKQKEFYDAKADQQYQYDTEVQAEWWPFGRSDR